MKKQSWIQLGTGLCAVPAAALCIALTVGCASETSEGPSEADNNVQIIENIVRDGATGAEDGAFLIERVQAGSLEEKVSAAWALGEVEVAGGGEALMAVLRDEPEVMVRVNAARALGSIGGSGDASAAAALLVSLLAEEDAILRSAAMYGLGGEAFPLDCETICPLVPSFDDALRLQAVDLLASKAEPCAVPCLMASATDAVAEIRSMAAFGLGRAGDGAALETLIALLGDSDPKVRANAAQALGMIGDSAATPHLEAIRKDEYGIVQDAVKAALAKLAS